MSHYRRAGDVPRKRHTVHTDGAGHRYLEELVGAEGFSSDSSLLYHRCSPSALVSVSPEEDPRQAALAANHPLRPRHLRLGGLAPDRFHVVAGNADVTLGWEAMTVPTELRRSAAGDEIRFVHEGRGVLESVFGTMAVAAGDYVVVPNGITHRWVPDRAMATLVIEAAGHVTPPARYLSARGQFLEHAPYCERDLRAPDGPLVVDETGEVDVVVRTRAGVTRHRYAHHPFDVVGWDGCLYPWALAISDFEPIVGSLHQPPPVHQTFQAPGVVVCSFVPRRFDLHPDAVKIPYHHSNVDSDEVLFYAAGDFMSRAGAGIGAASMTVHPAGFVHGPQPGSYERSVDADRTEETAVMIDTFRPLSFGPAADEVDDPSYTRSWLA